MSVSTLINKNASVSSKQWAIHLLAAAVLANERCNAVTLQPSAKKNELKIVPGSIIAKWSNDTLESRLQLQTGGLLSDLVYDWLGIDVQDPWSATVERAKIAAVINRRIIQGDRTLFSEQSYYVESEITDKGLDSAIDLIAKCRDERPDIWRALTNAINDGLSRRKHKSKNSKEYLWSLESSANQDKFSGQKGITAAMVSGPWTNTILTLLIGVGAHWLAAETEQMTLFWVCTLIFLMILGILSIPSKIARKFYALLPNYGYDPFELPLVTRVTGVFAGSAILVILTLLASMLITQQESSQLTLIILAGIVAALYYGLKKLKQRTGKAITQSVERNSAKINQETVSSAALKADMKIFEPKLKTSQSPPSSGFKKRELDASNLPEASAQAQQRIEAINARGIASRQLYQRTVAFLIISAVFILVLPSLFQAKPPNYFLLGLATFSLLLLNARFARWIRRFLLAIVAGTISGGNVSIESDHSEVQIKSIRATGLQLLGWIWIFMLIGFSPDKNTEEPFTYLAVIVVVLYLLVTTIFRKRLEKRYPYQPALNLLALRVFDSPSLNDFLDLTSDWQYLGTRQRLDGPLTAGQKLRDLLNYVTGNIENSIVNDTDKANSAITAFRNQPDRNLRFPLNSIQCGREIWRDVLEKLLLNSDVIVMDLSYFTRERTGCSYEIAQLMQKVELSRVILLISDKTDLLALDEILEKSWQGTTADSINRIHETPCVTILHIGGSSERNGNESVEVWRARIRSQIKAKQLIALLYDQAMPRITGAIQPPKSAIRWSRIPLPGWGRTPIQFIVGIILVIWIIF